MLKDSEMSGLFFQIIDDAVGEIARRQPDYFQRFSLTFPTLATQAVDYAHHPQFQRFSPDEIERALHVGSDYVAEQCDDVQTGGEEDDPVARLILDSIMDAYAADRRALDLRPNNQMPRLLPAVLSDDYDERRTFEGRRFFIRKTGDRPLVLISACGIPLKIWSTFLGDQSHSFKIIVAESRSADLLDGGMPHYADITADSADIVTALDCARVEKAHVIAWCNGGRIAIDLAHRFPGRFTSLTLLSPTLRGMAGVAPQPSPFEDTMCRIFDALTEQPQLAEFFADKFEEQSYPVNSASVRNDPARRAASLFGAPAREYEKILVAPMLRPNFLINYARRVAFDEAYPINEALIHLDLPTLLVTGAHDNIVNNAFNCAALQAGGLPVTHASIKGGGHYLQDLQYPYFISILNQFLSDRIPIASARVDIGSLARTSRPGNVS